MNCRRIVGYLTHINAYDSILKQTMTAFVQIDNYTVSRPD